MLTGVTFCCWIFLLSRSVASDDNIVISVCLLKTPILTISFWISVERKRLQILNVNFQK